MSRAANRIQTRGDRNWIVQSLSLQQTLVRRVEVIPIDVKTGQRQTLARGFVRVLVGRSHIAKALAQWNRSRTALQGGSQALQSSIRRAVFYEQFGVEQGSLDFTNRFWRFVAHG